MAVKSTLLVLLVNFSLSVEVSSLPVSYDKNRPRRNGCCRLLIAEQIDFGVEKMVAQLAVKLSADKLSCTTSWAANDRDRSHGHRNRKQPRHYSVY